MKHLIFAVRLRNVSGSIIIILIKLTIKWLNEYGRSLDGTLGQLPTSGLLENGTDRCKRCLESN